MICTAVVRVSHLDKSMVIHENTQLIKQKSDYVYNVKIRCGLEFTKKQYEKDTAAEKAYLTRCTERHCLLCTGNHKHSF
jgi:hypothetical protein